MMVKWPNENFIEMGKAKENAYMIVASCPLVWDYHFYIFGGKYLLIYEIMLVINYDFGLFNPNLAGLTCLK